MGVGIIIIRKEVKMKGEIKKILEIVNAVNAFAESIEENNVTVEDLRVISQLNPKISDNIDALAKWISNKPMQLTSAVITETPSDEIYPSEDADPWLEIDPIAEWRFDKIDNLMVSSSGKFYDVESDKELVPRFVNGELRIDLSDSRVKRAAVIVAKTFKVWSVDNNGVIEYTDGDHRNIDVSNLFWRKKDDSRPTSSYVMLIEDICRRIIEYKCDMNKIMLAHKDATPSVSKELITSIIKKERNTNISDRFFILDGDEIVPVKDLITDSSETVDTSFASAGYDIGLFLITTGDTVIAETLLKDKIKSNANLSAYEKEILVFSAIKKIGGNRMPSTMVINKMIKEMYGVTMTISVIDELKTKTDSISNIYEVYGG